MLKLDTRIIQSDFLQMVRFRRIADNIGRSTVRRGAEPKTGLPYDITEKT